VGQEALGFFHCPELLKRVRDGVVSVGDNIVPSISLSLLAQKIKPLPESQAMSEGELNRGYHVNCPVSMEFTGN
jgi:hypothetical protein